MWVPMGVDDRFSRRLLGVPVYWVLFRVVLMVITCLPVKLFDLGYRGKEVMWSVCYFCMHLARS